MSRNYFWAGLMLMAMVGTSGCGHVPLKQNGENFLDTLDSSRHFRKITFSSGVNAYRLATKIAHNQQAMYLNFPEMSDDGLFLILLIPLTFRQLIRSFL